MWKIVRGVLWDNPHQRWFLWSLLPINIGGSIYGYWWYHNQLAVTPIRYWLLVPDSPLSSTLFALALLILLAGKHQALLELWAYTAVIKYGIWAMVIIADFWLGGGLQELTEWMLFLSHGGMALEGFLFLRHLRLRSIHVLSITAWMLFNDYVDYAWEIHPYFFTPDQGGIAFVTVVTLSITLTFMAWNRVTAC